MLKRLALGGVAVVGGTGLLAGTQLAAKPPDGRGGGRPAPDPTPTPGPTPTPTPTPAPGDPIGVPLTEGSLAFVEFLTYKGGRGAKARLRVAEAGGDFHGWHRLAGGEDDNMLYESMAIDYVDQAVPVAGDATHPAYLDVKAGFGGYRPHTGSFSFYYWHGPSAEKNGSVFVGATYYTVTVFVVSGEVTGHDAIPVDPTTVQV